MAGPIDPRLLRRARATRGYLVAGVAVGSATAILTLGQAWLLSRSVADVFATGSLATLGWAVTGLAAVFGGKALLAWAGEWLAQRTAAAVKSQLRRDIMAARLARPLQETSSGGLITLVTQGLDGLDGYFSKYLPQLLLAVTVPLVVGLAILRADLLSAVVVAVTLPLIPLFMALVGWTTEAVTRKRWTVQTRLANHFADLIAGLPTLQVFGRAKAQAEGLSRTEAQHRSETMRTLRVSFLSALVLELLATLSVAIIAVTIGFRVVFGELDLTTALFVLILAPEAYLPVRQVGVHYHDAADGLAAVEQAFAVIDGPAEAAPVPAADGTGEAANGEAPAAGPVPLLSVRGLTHTYPGAAAPAVAPVSFDLSAGEVVALAGASGGGKTTLLNAVMGFLSPTGGRILADGLPITDVAAWRRRVAWVGQAPGLVSGTVADNVALGSLDASPDEIADALARAGAGALPPSQPVGDDAEGVSAGERRRIAVARALLRVRRGGISLLVLDEPTAGLDSDTEADLLRSLRELAVGVLVVSHRAAVLATADRVVLIGEDEPEAVTPTLRQAQGSSLAELATPTLRQAQGSSTAQPDLVTLRQAQGASEAEPPTFRQAHAPSIPATGQRALLRRLFAAVPDARRRLVAAVLLAFAATGASVALMGVSAWLLSRAAEHPPVLYLQAAAVAVRFFGISRGGFRYTERLVGHDVALRLQSALRLETYRRLARTTLLGRRRGDLLARVIADVEAIQDLVVRVWIPFAASAGVLVVTAAILAWFSPGAAAVLLASTIVAGIAVPWLAQRASARADAAALPLRGRLADSVRELTRTAPDLLAYGADGASLAAFERVDADLRRLSAHSAWVRGVGSAAQVLAAGTAVIGALVIGAGQVHDGRLAAVMLAVLVLTPLALHEALATLIAAAQTRTRARAALGRVTELLDAEPVGAGDRPSVGDAVADPRLALDGLAVGWPGGDVVLSGLDLTVAAGERVALVGPSGIGKTTVAATVLGFIPARAGTVEVQGRIGYLAQDAHIFTTSIAENVRIGNRDATPSDVAGALARAGLGLDPDRIVGEAGDTLSGGEARRVALSRLLVGDFQVLLLDEPTEHLDPTTATALIDDIWATTLDSPVLVITHDPGLVARCDRVVSLG
jgi:ATP-binding cassette subfamily C protein CydCD